VSVTPVPERGLAAPHAELWGLENLRRARRLCDFMFEQFAPFVGGTVAEVGAGIGTFSERMLERGVQRLLLIEPEDECMERLERDFGGDARVRLARETLPESPALRDWEASCDFILAQNVVEHIADDEAAMAAMRDALRPGGRVTVLAPAHRRLFGSIDRAYGHHRRYSRADLRALVEGAGLVIDDLYFFNLLGLPGWWVQSRRRSNGISRGSLAAYEALLRLWRPIERRLRPPFGLSLIAHAQRPEA
jgi:SAM-dependent methyltransferase